MVLGLRDEPLRPERRALERVTLPLNQAAAVPRPAAGHLEVSVRLRPSLLGRLVSLPWKLPEVRLGLLSADPAPPRRILAATAGSPFRLAAVWPDTAEQLWDVYAEPHAAPPDALALVTRGDWAWRDAVVEFYQVE